MTSFATQYNIKYYSPYCQIGQHVLKAVQTLTKKFYYSYLFNFCFVLFFCFFLHLCSFYKISQTMKFNLKVSFESTKYFMTKFMRCIHRGYYTVVRRYGFYFRVAKQYFTNEFSEYCFCNEKIKFISSSRRVMFFLLYRQKDIDKIIDFCSPKSNCDSSDLQYNNVRHWLQ